MVMNVTITEPDVRRASSPCGHRARAMPTASSLNYSRGLTVANLVIVKLGGDGAVNFANAFGSTQLIADVVGYFG